MPDRGIIFIAAGAAYAQAATNAARSIRQNSPQLEIDLFTDAPGAASDVFDKVHEIPNPHKRSKVDCLPLTRFWRTLYLDTDVQVIADITEMFDVLDRFDIALSHAHSRNRKVTRANWRQLIPDAFPQLNGGVILYKSSPNVLDFLKEWAAAYHAAGFKKDQVTLRELLWSSDLRLHILPPEYNIRYEKYLSVWTEKEAVPKILHLARLHESVLRSAQPPPGRMSKISRGPTKLVNRDFLLPLKKFFETYSTNFHSKKNKRP